MNNKVFISCAVTGSGDTASKHPDLPKTPDQIATAAIDAAKAGAAIAHIHVREEDGTPSRKLDLYKQVVDKIRSSDTDVVLNLTTGMGGDLDIGQSVVVQQRRVLAIEGAEGTNEMIARTAELIDKSQPDTVFVKMAKSGQDIALDMPVFGLETLSYLEKSGIKTVCLEGEKIMLADPLDVISAAADKAGVSISTFASLSEKADD